MEFIHRALRRSGPRVAFAAAVSTALLGVSLPLHGPGTPASTAHAAARTAGAVTSAQTRARASLTTRPALRARMTASSRVSPAATTAQKSDAARALLSALPLTFEPNRGQAAANVRFLSHGNSYTLDLTNTDAIVRSTVSHKAATTVRFHLVGANPRPSIIGQDRQAGTTNYLLGNDPQRWHTGVSLYSKVAYRGVYPGVNLTYYGTQGHIEYDFRLAPGANTRLIRLAITGDAVPHLTAAGDLVAGPLRELRPIAYQVVAGYRHSVNSLYVLNSHGQVGFGLGVYNHHLPLVIDPILNFSTLDGSSDSITAIAIDPAGYIYITGSIYPCPPQPYSYPCGQTLTATQGYTGTESAAGAAVFVAKLDPHGPHVVYTAYLGGSASNLGMTLALDDRGDVFVGGQTSSGNFPFTTNAYQPCLKGDTSGFITKLSPDGRRIIYSTFLGGSTSNSNAGGANAVTGIAVDRSGHAFVTGYTFAYNFPLATGGVATDGAAGCPGWIYKNGTNRTLHGHPFQGSLGYGKGTLGTQEDAFVAKLTPSGSGLVYSTYLGGSGTDTASGIAIDGSGNAYITGQTNSLDFPSPRHAFQAQLVGSGTNSFITKLNATGTDVIYSTYLGQSASDQTHAITVDRVGNAYITGQTTGGIPRTVGVAQPASGGGIDAFVSKLNARGVLTYSTYLGGAGDEIGYGIAVDGAGDAYVTGSTSSATFTTPAFPLSRAVQGALGGNRGGFGMLDTFVAKLDPCGSSLLYSSYFGGTFVDTGYTIAVDRHGNAFVGGSTLSPNFPLLDAFPQEHYYRGPYPDAFVAEIGGSPITRGGACALPLIINNASTVVPLQVAGTSAITITGTLTVTIHTASHATVAVTLLARNTTPQSAPLPGTKKLQGPKIGAILFRATVRGKADAFGLYIGAIRLKVPTVGPYVAQLSVTTTSGRHSTTSTTPVTLGS